MLTDEDKQAVSDGYHLTLGIQQLSDESCLSVREEHGVPRVLSDHSLTDFFPEKD